MLATLLYCDLSSIIHPAGKLVPFVELTVAHASILTILAISFERYYAICEPLKAGYVCTKTRAMIICVVCWCVAGLFTRYCHRYPLPKVKSARILFKVD